MHKLYKELIRLQKTTIGATFTLTYSTKRNKYKITFSNLFKTIESGEVKDVLQEAILFIEENKRPIVDAQNYTMHR